ncbi:histidinol phosphate phosphatase domain-containing protein [Halorutilales archaeon Cl-col2-1]
MIDFHSHTFYSDGELVPAEQARRAEVQGVDVVGITDHADGSNVEDAVERVLDAKETASIRLLAGVEVTHVPPENFASVVERARDAGADVVIAHGETTAEPVTQGTNRAAIEAGVDILGHPGLIDREDVRLAADKDVYLELSSRRGHSLANGHVARLAEEEGASLIVNTDSHAPSDFITREKAIEVAQSAGLSRERAIEVVDGNSEELLDRIDSR